VGSISYILINANVNPSPILFINFIKESMKKLQAESRNFKSVVIGSPKNNLLFKDKSKLQQTNHSVLYNTSPMVEGTLYKSPRSATT